MVNQLKSLLEARVRLRCISQLGVRQVVVGGDRPKYILKRWHIKGSESKDPIRAVARFHQLQMSGLILPSHF